MNAKEYLNRVHALPCIVCVKMGQRQTTPTCAHHVESVRDEDSAYGVVAICDACHKLLHSMSRRGFLMLTKLTDVDMISLTIKAFVQELNGG